MPLTLSEVFHTEMVKTDISLKSDILKLYTPSLSILISYKSTKIGP